MAETGVDEIHDDIGFVVGFGASGEFARVEDFKEFGDVVSRRIYRLVDVLEDIGLGWNTGGCTGLACWPFLCR